MDVLQDLADKAVNYAINTGASYCDARADIIHQEYITIENGEIEYAGEKTENGIGIKMLKKGAWVFFSLSNPQNFEQIRGKIDDGLGVSEYSVKNRKTPVELSYVPTYVAKKKFPVMKRPDIDGLIHVGMECSKIILEKPKIIKSTVKPAYLESTKYFKNSEGSEILQSYTDTIIDMVATAYESGIAQSINITEGGRGGLETITDNSISMNSAERISKKASELIYAKHVKEEKATVVMNPDFVALLTHEILGHPSEADRVLGKEMAWAGGAWWNGKIGEKIGSENLNVFDDPTISQSLGWYDYDDEGVKTRKTQIIERGVLKNHLQNRETAKIFETNPTGNMRATNFAFMPLIRMACTCIGNGDWKQEEMIKDVKKGYFISNMKIPSIDMRRYNWSISCQYAQKIENGQLTDLLRDIVIVGTAPEFFDSIDACGNDFEVRPITNCGKGDPMQSMMMGNGGPSIRGTATVKSVI